MTATLIEIIFFMLLVVFTPPRNATISSFLGFEQTNSIRGLAILMVILMHSSCNLGMRTFTPCGGIGVSLFLILSGYGLSESFKKKGCGKYWSNKIRKIWIPYIVVLTVVKMWYSSFDSHSVLQYFCIDSPFWYISFLFYNYILFYVSHKYGKLYKYRFVLFLVMGCLLFFFDTRIRAEQCLCFVTGMWLSEKKEKIHWCIGKKRTSLFLLLLLLIVSAVALFAKQVPSFRYMVQHERLLQNFIELLIKYSFALAFICAFSICSRLWNGKIWSVLIGNRFLAYCSTISLELYIVHFSLMPLLNKESPLMSMSVFMVLSFALSSILYYLNKYVFSWKK